ncbi:MAG: MBL fold metallo-hydrolase [Candidatus Pacebacteria bacterium]|nr:MBL fold metallo-hydrolase [Candidatus Paceibacterota bacterium]
MEQNKDTEVNKAAITFYGGAGGVTGANFLFEFEDARILVDCGFVQGEQYCHDCNYDPFPYDPASIDILFVTHAHADHIGRIPKLVRDGFRGKIYSTPATRDLARVMFEDALTILAHEARERGKPIMYEREDIDRALNQWETIRYHEEQSFPQGFSVTLKDAGHILGSAILEFAYDGKKIVFTGDLGNSPSPLLPDTESIKGATHLVMESVYGDRNHEGKDDREGLLVEAIKDTISRKGTLLIPAFSLDRTQVLLYFLNNLIEDGVVPEIPVFLDSPLAIRATDIYTRYSDDFKDEVRKEIREGDNIFQFPLFKKTRTVPESRVIMKTPGPKIIIAGSGMSVGGRVLEHEKHILSDSKNTLLFIGYQGAGTLGRRLREGAKEVTIYGDKVFVRAEVRAIDGFSAHKDSDHLIDFVADAKDTLKQAFVVMGEPKASLFLTQRLRDELGVNATVPEKGSRVELF